MATIAQSIVREERFYQKMAIGLAVFILFGFAQFAARGFVPYARVPTIFHLHGLVMVGWLALVVAQTSFVARDNIAAHRRLGWIGLLLATLIAPLAIATCITAIRTGFMPPFFTAPFFLALVTVGVTLFTLTIWTAIALRRRTDWHRRLMIGALVLLMEPALGRLLPMPLLGGETGEWVALVIQLLTLGLLARHDRGFIGRVHPATLSAAAIVISGHVLLTVGARVPAVIDYANSLTA